MFTTIDAFLKIWSEECERTELLFKAIPEGLWYKEVIPAYRTLARLGWHLVQTPGEMLERCGLEISGPLLEDPVPTESNLIVQGWLKVHVSVTEQISKNWTDSTLKQMDDMYGMQWTRSKTLTCLLHHLIHHRGQMTVLLRAGGAAVPGLYGPAREEREQYGMRPAKV